MKPQSRIGFEEEKENYERLLKKISKTMKQKGHKAQNQSRQRGHSNTWGGFQYSSLRYFFPLILRFSPSLNFKCFNKLPLERPP
jgi:hypothetical protein